MNDAVARETLAGDDAAARRRALDVTRSFLVQAPAGSGKTGLLIQRYLALLAHVDRPERVVALTFTRKAAAEMQDRIVEALREASDGVAPKDDYHAATLALAARVLAQDEKQGWKLFSHTARLRVMTIDAFCAALARQAPLATRLGASPRVDEHAMPIYLRAARAALDAAGPDDAGWQRLLSHLDNDAGRVVTLLADLLAKRDQWLPEIVGGAPAVDRGALEAVLAEETEGELAAIRAALPQDFAQRLRSAQHDALAHLAGDPDKAALAELLTACADAGGLPAAEHAALAQWQALAQWLLIRNKAQFRVAGDRNAGFPAKGKGPQASVRGARNDAMRSLLADLAALPGFALTLDAVRHLPPPRYADATWDLIEALVAILPRVAAHLRIAFADSGAIDFVEAQIAAREALGSPNAPSELLLRLDFSIDHLLIDEFQDTSFSQIALIERLTAGWEPGDRRTLFAVGDPMQSIYRFREAEVRLFVEAQASRMIGNVEVEPIVLSRNFRAHGALVQWVNATFAGVLGGSSDPWRGIVAFAPAVAHQEALPGPAVTFDVSRSHAAEAQAVVRHVQAALTEDKTTVAILVRARTHLADILPALRSVGIAYSAVDLDALAERPAILDLLALTHAIAQPADRLAILAALRAPWCGMDLADLLALTSAADSLSARSIALHGREAGTLAALSPDGRTRFVRVGDILGAAIEARGRATLSSRVRGAWLALAGPATLDDAIDLDAAERFFATLAEHEIAGDVPDWAAFVAALAQLRAAPQAQDAARVQVMTLHRAKGLEFDVVIMPGLARPPKGQDAPLIRWRRRPKGLLLSPLKERGGVPDPVYAYLARLAKGEEEAELGRVLYVGCTRARRRLHLLASLDVVASEDGRLEWKDSRSGSALARFGSALDPLQLAPDGASEKPAESVRAPLLARLPSAWTAPAPYPSVPARGEPEAARDQPPFDWVRETARQVGIVAHRLFAQIGREGIAAWDDKRVRGLRPRIGAELAANGIDGAELVSAVAQVEAAIVGLLADSRGRWLFAPEHTEARSEWALGGVVAGATIHVVLDRTFVAGDVRYIVDFKTGVHEGADLGAFLDGEVLRYRDQLARYAAIVRALDPRPIRLALYYPLLREWREWPAA